MGYVVDTSYLIDLVRGDPAAVQKATEIAESGASTLLSSLVLYEILTGLLHRGSRTEANRFRRVLARFMTLPFDDAAARVAAEIQAELLRLGRRSSDIDVMLAALAAHHGHVLVTADRNLLGLDIGIGLDVETY